MLLNFDLYLYIRAITHYVFLNYVFTIYHQQKRSLKITKEKIDEHL